MMSVSEELSKYIKGEAPWEQTSGRILDVLRTPDAIGQEFTESEVRWLKDNLVALPKMVQNRLCSSVFYGICKYRSINTYQLAKAMRYKAVSPVRRWVKKLESIGLMAKQAKKLGWVRGEAYFPNRASFPNLIDLLLVEMEREHGQPDLERAVGLREPKAEPSLKKFSHESKK